MSQIISGVGKNLSNFHAEWDCVESCRKIWLIFWLVNQISVTTRLTFVTKIHFMYSIKICGDVIIKIRRWILEHHNYSEQHQTTILHNLEEWRTMNMSDMHHHNSGGSTGDSMSGSMRSTFGSWSQFQLQLLFETWNITEQWQFALTWFAVVTSVVVYHLLEYALLILQHGMLALLSQSQEKESDAIVRPNGWLILKMITSFIIACKYGLSLFFMMIAMSFNPSLFLALVIGYLIGGYACCEYAI